MGTVSQVTRQASKLIMPLRPVLDLEYYVYQPGMFVGAFMDVKGTENLILPIPNNLKLRENSQHSH